LLLQLLLLLLLLLLVLVLRQRLLLVLMWLLLMRLLLPLGESGVQVRVVVLEPKRNNCAFGRVELLARGFPKTLESIQQGLD